LETEKIRLYDDVAVLLHFKFIKPDLSTFFKRRVALNQDWNDSSEYKSYFKEFSEESGVLFFDHYYSRKYRNIKSLNAFFKSITVSKNEKARISTMQKVGLFLFGLSIRLLLTDKQYSKLKITPQLFFHDSKNNFVRYIGNILSIK
jgi:hypothetical protein